MRFIVHLLIMCAAVCCFGDVQSGKAEIRLERDFIFPKVKRFPTPTGVVDENSPFLHYPVLPEIKTRSDRKKFMTEKGQKNYYFKLSQDSAFKRDVIESGACRWCFYNPYRQLSKGTWHWKAGVSKQGGSVEWSKTFKFEIRGDERVIDAPSADALVTRLCSEKGPYVIGTDQQVGNLLPKSTQLYKEFQEYRASLKEINIPSTFITPESAVPEKLKQDLLKRGMKDKIFTYRKKRTRDLYTRFCGRTVQSAIKLYFLTGSNEDKKRAQKAYKAAKDGYYEIVQAKMNMDFIEGAFNSSSALYYDVFSSEMSADERAGAVALLEKQAEDIFMKLLDNLENMHHNSHDWQSDFTKGFFLCMVIARDSEHAREWVKYFYDLWMFRAPNGSRSDGGWFAGNGYVGANQGCLTTVPVVLGQLLDYDYFQHPWYKNVSRQFALAGPAGGPAGAYGDNAEKFMNKMIHLSQMLTFYDKENVWNSWRIKSVLENRGKFAITPKEIMENGISWYFLAAMKHANRYDMGDFSQITHAPAQSGLFNDIGLVTSHTDLNDMPSNVGVIMRSCPYGQLAHAHAAQNAFNITAGGEKLFYKTGYYTSHADAHTLQSYKHTRAHNTILADGFAQDLNPTGYGWIARYLDNDDITYALGDASNAYNGNYGGYAGIAAAFKLELTEENGYGDPDVTRFRRHMLFLKPNHLIIYDELKAAKEVEWTFRLNSPHTIEKTGDNSVRTENSGHYAQASLYSSDTMVVEVTDQFVGEAFDFQGKIKSGTANQWHSSFKTAQKTAATHFLTVIDISKKDGSVTHSFTSYPDKGLGKVKAGDYTIWAQLDATKKSYLMATNGNTTLSTGEASQKIKANGELYASKVPGSTIVLSKGEISEYVDQLPDAVIYGNLY